MKKARPTEYKGIRYRSKSEAMFARFLELEAEESRSIANWERTQEYGRFNEFGCGVGGFTYEPEGFDVDDWGPDFLTWNVRGGQGAMGAQVPCLSFELIEYKPSRPTDTYIAEACDKFRRIFDRFEEEGAYSFSRRCEFGIYYGSIFTDSRGVVGFVPPSWRIVDRGDEDWLANYEKVVRATRFDLKEPME